MVSLANTTNTEETKSKSKFNDEFESYLQKQCLKTTFNGLEIETFSWYKKVLGLLQYETDQLEFTNKKAAQTRAAFLYIYNL